MPMKKFLFLSALVVMGFACVGCTTTDNNTNPAPIESTTPTTDNINGNGTTTNGTTTNGTTTNGTGNMTNGVATDKNGVVNDGTTTNNNATTKK